MKINLKPEQILEQLKTDSILKLMIKWCLCLVIVFIVMFFIHETLHGFLGLLDERSSSTGFLTVGNPYTFPDDPDFRIGWTLPTYPSLMWLLASAGPTYAGLLIAIIATIILVRFKKISIGTLIAGATMIAGTIFVILSGIFIFIRAIFGGVLHVEDKSIQGLILAMYNKGEDLSLLTFKETIHMPLNDLIFSPWFWLPIIVPFSIALICYIIGDKKMKTLFISTFERKWFWLYTTGVPVLSIIISFSIMFWLDRIIRINWIAY